MNEYRIRVALVGRPNVGKSSLFNALVGHRRAIVTAIPGTTRDTLAEAIGVEGFPVLLIDTAGIRRSKDEIELIGVERARRAAATQTTPAKRCEIFDAWANNADADSQAKVTQEQERVAVKECRRLDRNAC